MPVIDVTSVGDPRLVDYASLNHVETRRALERRGSFFIAESELVIRALFEAGDRWPVRSVLVTTARFEAMREVLEPAAASGTTVFVAPMAVVREITGFHIHRGAVASAERGDLPRVEDVLSVARTVAVLEAVTDHENLGSIFRNAAAFGVDAVLLDERSADPLYRRSVRVSMGHVLHVPFTRISTLEAVRAQGFTLAALTPAADAIAIDDFVANRPEKVALMLGAEGPGLSEGALTAADVRVRIAIASRVDSLNVAVAAAIAFHRLA